MDGEDELDYDYESDDGFNNGVNSNNKNEFIDLKVSSPKRFISTQEESESHIHTENMKRDYISESIGGDSRVNSLTDETQGKNDPSQRERSYSKTRHKSSGSKNERNRRDKKGKKDKKDKKDKKEKKHKDDYRMSKKESKKRDRDTDRIKDSDKRSETRISSGRVETRDRVTNNILNKVSPPKDTRAEKRRRFDEQPDQSIDVGSRLSSNYIKPFLEYTARQIQRSIATGTATLNKWCTLPPLENMPNEINTSMLAEYVGHAIEIVHSGSNLKFKALSDARTFSTYFSGNNLIKECCLLMPGQDDILLFVKLKNEAFLLPQWLDYYKSLGVTWIIALDNGSTDDSLDILRNARSEDFVVELWTDLDEFLAFEGIDSGRTLRDLIFDLSERKQPALSSFLLDIYPKDSLSTVSYDSKKLPWESFSYHDFTETPKVPGIDVSRNYIYMQDMFQLICKTNPRFRMSTAFSYTNQKKIESDIHWTFMEKIPLVYMQEGVQWNAGYHAVFFRNVEYMFCGDRLNFGAASNVPTVSQGYNTFRHAVTIHACFAKPDFKLKYDTNHMDRYEKIFNEGFFDNNCSKLFSFENLPYLLRQGSVAESKSQSSSLPLLSWEWYHTDLERKRRQSRSSNALADCPYDLDEVKQKYKLELDALQKYVGNENIYQIFLKYGLTVNGEFIPLKNSINLYEVCFMSLVIQGYWTKRFESDKKDGANALHIGLAYGVSASVLASELKRIDKELNKILDVIDKSQATEWNDIGIAILEENIGEDIKLTINKHDEADNRNRRYDIIVIDVSRKNSFYQDLIMANSLLKINGIVFVKESSGCHKFCREMNSSYKRVSVDEISHRLKARESLEKSRNKHSYFFPSSLVCLQKISSY